MLVAYACSPGQRKVLHRIYSSVVVQLLGAKYPDPKSVTSHLLTSETMFPLLRAYTALRLALENEEHG